MRQFIEACHQRGIAVLIDVVYNHLGPTDLEYSVWKFDGYSAASDTGGIYFYEDDNRYTRGAIHGLILQAGRYASISAIM